jgi:hypothetical protein
MRWKTLVTLLTVSLLSAIAVSAFDLAGTWTGQLTMRPKDRETQRRDVKLTLRITGSSVTGTLSGTWHGKIDSAEILDVKLANDELSFSIATGAIDVPRFKFTGKPEGDHLTFTVTGINAEDGKEMALGDCVLQRSK